ncbi:unnamed protein product, partial [Medioppia subpectinata]
FGTAWDNDPYVVDLLVTIILFNPDRPNLIHKEMVKLQQQLYMYLLKRYFHMKYGSSCAAQERFLRIINSLEELSKFVTIHREAQRMDYKTQIGPLLREVLDLPALDNCPNNNDYTLTVL